MEFYKERYNYLRSLVVRLQCEPNCNDELYNTTLNELENARNRMNELED